MIEFVVGLPGAGKSYLCMRSIVGLLRKNPAVTVVTNLPIDLDRLQEYLSSTGSAVCVANQVRILEPEQAVRFWLYRGRGRRVFEDRTEEGWIDCVQSESKDGLIVLEHEKMRVQSVHYFLDEVHTLYPSRQWTKTGPALLVYTSQHRHFGDDVVLVSQHPNQVDKQLRMLVQVWTYVTNLRQRSLMGIRVPGKFLVTRYPEMVTGSLHKPPKLSVSHVGDDPAGVMSCYRTMDGVGIVGAEGIEDSSRTGRGFGPWFWVVACLAIFALVWVLLKGAKWGVSSLVAGDSVVPGLASPADVDAEVPVDRSVEPARSGSENLRLSGSVRTPVSYVPIGWSRSGTGVTVWLEDGSRLLPGHPDVVGVQQGRVHFRGQGWVRFRAPVSVEREMPIKSAEVNSDSAVIDAGE